MVNRWKGNLVANAATSSGTAYTGKADGAWGLNSQLQQKVAGQWARGIGAPNAPTSVVATGAAFSATVAFTAPTETGGNGATLSSYTATSNPEGITGTGTSSPVTVTGLTNGTAYTFTVKATNSLGFTGPDSTSSNSITPFAYKSVAFTSDNSPGISVYKFGGGFNTKFTDTTFVSSGVGVAFAPAGNYLAVGYTSSPYVGVYPWSASGFGARYANPSTLPSGGCLSVSFNPTGNSLVVGSAITPFVLAYPWSSGGFGTKYADPTTLPTSIRRCVSFNPSGTILATSGDAGRIAVYNWNSGFGTKYADPSSGFTAVQYYFQVKFNPAGNVLASSFGLNTATPFLDTWAWSNGFGTRYANPTTLPTGAVVGLNFDSTGSTLMATGNNSPYLNAYQWSNGFGTKYADPSISAGFSVGASTFDYSNTSVIGCSQTSPFVVSYAWSNASGFGAKYAAPSVALPGSTNNVAAGSV
jgi:hypothetical protein